MSPTRRPSQPSEARLAQALREIPRGLFFSAGMHRSVSDDRPVPVGRGRTLPPVPIVVKMIGGLELDGSERVLDVFGGTGYQAALLSRLAREVRSIEFDEKLASRAARTLAKIGCENVRVIHHADAGTGWPRDAPYQGIVVGAAAAELPHALVEQLDLGGRLIIALGDDRDQLIERLRKRVDGIASDVLGPCCCLDVLAGSRTSWFPWTPQRKR